MDRALTGQPMRGRELGLTRSVMQWNNPRLICLRAGVSFSCGESRPVMVVNGFGTYMFILYIQSLKASRSFCPP